MSATVPSPGRTLAAGLSFTCLALLLGCGDGDEPRAARWVSTQRLPVAVNNVELTLLDSGKVLASGGIDQTDEPVANASLFDPGPGTWTATDTLLAPRGTHRAVKLASGKVLVVGGWRTGAPATETAEFYDPATGTWAPTAGAMSAARAGPMAAFLPSGKLLVAGGVASTTAEPTATAELYDPATGTFGSTGSMGVARWAGTATALASGKVLVVGGLVDPLVMDGQAAATATAELYDPVLGTFGGAGSLPQPVTMHSATLLAGGKVLVAGGSTAGYPFAPSGRAFLYDPATGWSETGAMRVARVGHVARLLPSGEVMVAAGTLFSDRSSTTEVYDPHSGQWSDGEAMVSFHGHLPGAAVLANGDWLVAGGLDMGGGTGTLLDASERWLLP